VEKTKINYLNISVLDFIL